MILKAKHNRLFLYFSNSYTVWKMKKHFDSIKIIGEFNEKNRPVLLISNHISWWDGLWAIYLNRKVFERKFHFMMLEEQLRKFWFFNYIGGYSINPKSKSMLESLRYTNELLGDKNNIVLVFPQGEIQSMHNHKFHFEKGIHSILKNVENQIQTVFIANFVDYFSKPKPTLNIYIKEFSYKNLGNEEIQNYYNLFYNECIEKQIQIPE